MMAYGLALRRVYLWDDWWGSYFGSDVGLGVSFMDGLNEGHAGYCRSDPPLKLNIYPCVPL